MSIKKSLEENREEILKNLPPEFHADFEKNLQEIEEPQQMSKEEVIESVKKEIPSEFAKDAEEIDNEVNPESNAASKEEEEWMIDQSLPEEVKNESKK